MTKPMGGQLLSNRTESSLARRTLLAMGPAFLILMLGPSASSAPASEPARPSPEVMYERYLQFWDYVVDGSIEPHWLADGTSFWFALGAPENTRILRVDPAADVVTPLFDVEKVRESLIEHGRELRGRGLPFDEFRFVDETERIAEFVLEAEHEGESARSLFHLDLATYTLTRQTETPDGGAEDESATPRDGGLGESPDGLWRVTKEDYDLWLHSTSGDREIRLTDDGEEHIRWRVIDWSPDGTALVLEKSDTRDLRRSPRISWLDPDLEIHRVLNPVSGESYSFEFHLFDIEEAALRSIEAGRASTQKLRSFGWSANGEFFFGRVSNWYQRLELLSYDPEDRAVRTVITETSDTFLSQRFVNIPNWRTRVTWLEDRARFIWYSERDGWRHLYLYREDGTLLRRLTHGDWPVYQWGEIEVLGDWVYFWGHPDLERPYDLHYLRVRLDGTDLTRITSAPGQHRIARAPSGEYLLDTHSTLSELPRVDLLEVDGTLVRRLHQAEFRVEAELDWSPPEEFVVEGSDGATDLHGVLFKPRNFEPNRSYPVIESIYQGPQARFVLRGLAPSGSWRTNEAYRAQALAQLGFVVVMVDGRGTPERGKAFHDVVYGDFGRFEIREHAGVLRQLAAERPYMDLSRVGIYGASWGGYYTTRALLLAPELYKVGVALVPSHPSGWIHEPFLGPPSDNEDRYRYAENETHVDELEGHLLLISGTDDFWYPDLFSLIESLIRADKPYDLLLLPERGHDLGERVPGDPAPEYLWNALVSYFQEHL